MPGIYPLKGTVKHYDWGGFSFIPALLQKDNSINKPYAEYWMGTHPLGMGMVEKEDGTELPLSSFTPHLPYLFKAQDVKEMLSIQVHPGKAAAEKEFARENAAGVPLDAPHRNYKDDNHKPEMLVALGDFWLLHGFKAAKELVYTLLNVVELRELLPVFNKSGYAGLYKYVMEMPQQEVNRILQPLIDNITTVYGNEQPDKYDEDYWAAKAAATFTKHNNIDRGIFSIYLLNIVQLKKGEGLFQAEGVPHAYLQGQCVEIMANSDNVLRGGLTTKHIDVKELLKHVKCEATRPDIITGELIHNERVFHTPVPDFRLSVFEVKAGESASFIPTGIEILLLTEGKSKIDEEEKAIQLQYGHPAAVILPGQTVYLRAEETSTIFRASVPIHNR